MYKMVSFFEHQKTIGIVGMSPDADNFIARANALGYFTHQLCQKEEDLEGSTKADKLFIGSLSEDEIQREFIMESDLLIYFDSSIQLAELEEAQKSLVIPQGGDLLAISQDRSLQKAFYESIGVNIAPYEIIVKEKDIVNAIPSLGYPALLRRNVIQEDEELDSYFIYDEGDIHEASELLNYGPAVLESWIISEHQLAVTLVKTDSGDIQLYPIVKKYHENERLSKIMKFKVEDEELAVEIEKAARLVAENIPFVGVITIDFIISPSQALYLEQIYPYPNILSRYTEGNDMQSSLETHLRAVSSLSLGEIEPEKVEFVYYPLYGDQKQKIDQLMMDHPKARFHFYPRIKYGQVQPDDEIGYLLTENEELNL